MQNYSEVLKNLISILLVKMQGSCPNIKSKDNYLINYLKNNYESIDENLMIYLYNYLFANLDNLINSQIAYDEDNKCFLVSSFSNNYGESIKLSDDSVFQIKRESMEKTKTGILRKIVYAMQIGRAHV